MVYQMDVKSSFLYEKIKEEVYVCQPPRFKDPDFPDKVYKVEKALYRLHQALRAWYETFSMFLLDNGLTRGKIDKTLFIRRHKDDILLVQVYVDDIIFGLTKKELFNAFKKMMNGKFQMSSIRELTFFTGLQVKQKQDGIFISQDKYDEDGKEVDVHMYRSMIGSLMYLTSLRPDIMFVVCKTVNGEVQLQALVDGKKVIITESTIRRDLQLEDVEGVDCLPNAVIFNLLTLMGDPIEHVAEKAVNKEIDDSLERAATTATSLDAEHNRGFLIWKLQRPKATQALKIDNLKRRLKKLERRKRLRTHGLKRLYKIGLSARVKSYKDESLDEEDASKQGRIADFDANEDIYLVNVHNDEDMFGVNDLNGDEVIVDVVEQAKEVNDITLDKALMAIKNAKPKVDKVVIQEPEQGTTTTTPITIIAASSRHTAKGLPILKQEQAPTQTVSLQQPSQVKDKGKGKMVEPKPMKKLSKKDQLMLDE
nr:copia protein [Tanacetum cinerariifolium]